eukprot:3033754-Amphidinium_carterae.1
MSRPHSPAYSIGYYHPHLRRGPLSPRMWYAPDQRADIPRCSCCAQHAEGRHPQVHLMVGVAGLLRTGSVLVPTVPEAHHFAPVQLVSALCDPSVGPHPCDFCLLLERSGCCGCHGYRGCHHD